MHVKRISDKEARVTIGEYEFEIFERDGGFSVRNTSGYLAVLPQFANVVVVQHIDR